MHVERTHHIDASDPDESGSYEYYYEYDLYRFIQGDTCLVARSYADEPNEAHFLNMEERGSVRPLISDDLNSPLLVAAQAHLRAEGKTTLSWLSSKSNGYEQVPA